MLLDYGDLVIHVFQPEPREFYALERLWADAPDETGKFADRLTDSSTSLSACSPTSPRSRAGSPASSGRRRAMRPC